MDFMKAFDQTVREIKREVNLKVLKVPEIEQKVLDATDDAPWGPHGSALVEIAQATKKFTECQMVMNVLWTRLQETGKDWRLVYKALTVIEYLVAHGSERAVDDIIEHSFQISALSSFEYVEPNGKDSGLNVRKKAETIVSLLNNKDKIQEVRNKASANRDKYIGLSSSGITYKSGSSSYGSSFQRRDPYGDIDGDSFDKYKGRDKYREEKADKDSYVKSWDNPGSMSKKGSAQFTSKDQISKSSHTSKLSSKINDTNKNNSVPSQPSGITNNYADDLDDDFDPRGNSSSKVAAESSSQVDLFGQSSLIDFTDEPAALPTETSTVNNNSSEADLFADAAFVSAPPQVEKEASLHSQNDFDLFASQPAIPSAVDDFFPTHSSTVQPETNASKTVSSNTNTVDPFAAVPLNNFDGSDVFGAFSSGPATTQSSQNPINDSSPKNPDQKSLQDPKPMHKEAFQVKSGIWADSLSRGLIDLNISAPKKVSLVDVGVVGSLGEGVDDREKGPPASFYMGRAMGTGSGLSRSGLTSESQTTDGFEFFSSLGSQQHQFGSFQK